MIPGSGWLVLWLYQTAAWRVTPTRGHQCTTLQAPQPGIAVRISWSQTTKGAFADHASLSVPSFRLSPKMTQFNAQALPPYSKGEDEEVQEAATMCPLLCKGLTVLRETFPLPDPGSRWPSPRGCCRQGAVFPWSVGCWSYSPYHMALLEPAGRRHWGVRKCWLPLTG